ncbi:pitrilysin family protein [Mastigocoleus sp. MO_188.B34]|uniref:M16 family metallopeptidase n=1 Tax=Mastigocoleus sp. MO_188.B34 TaxID=3036635 RepID=UPI002607957D|nr:pitrilysin family protein [Mastigocoleus sp. MO_188.B34]MDJ0692883.1 pitrilysin family protein [Mastigocoleus sp. MO_188.B34]
MFPASVFKLDNGLTFVHQEVSTTPVVVADVWVRAGTTLEPKPWFGIAHFLEHMIFKGTPTLPAGVFDRKIENQGGVTNAATSYDYVHYSLTTAANHLQETLPDLGELVLNAAIPEDEFLRERDVVLEEIRQAQDNPDWMVFRSLAADIYQNHPYGRPILGAESEVRQHSPEAMRCFHHTHYQPENTTVVVVGGIESTSALELVDRAFEYFPKRADYELPQQITKPVLSGITRQEMSLPNLGQARLIMAWITPGVENLDVAYGLDLLSAILAQGRTSRLIRDLRENQQLVQSIYSNFALQRESSLFTITAWLDSKNLERVELLIRNHLEDLISFGLSEEEITRSQRLLCNDYAFSTETPNQLAGLYGYYNTIAEVELAVAYPEKIQSFDSQKLQKIAQEYLSPSNYAVGILKP